MRRAPLHAAAETGSIEKVRHQLRKGVDVDAKDAEGEAPIHLAARQGHLIICTELIESAHADPNAQAEDGYTPLHYAAMYGHTEVAAVLLHSGAEPASKDMIGDMPLHLSSSNGHPEVSEALIERRADPGARGSGGNSPLHLAAINGHAAAVAVLLRRGADPNAQTDRQQTPLHGAASQGQLEVISLLLQGRADVHAVDKDGRTALERVMQQRSGDWEAVAGLLEGAAGEFVDEEGVDEEGVDEKVPGQSISLGILRESDPSGGHTVAVCEASPLDALVPKGAEAGGEAAGVQDAERRAEVEALRKDLEAHRAEAIASEQREKEAAAQQATAQQAAAVAMAAEQAAIEVRRRLHETTEALAAERRAKEAAQQAAAAESQRWASGLDQAMRDLFPRLTNLERSNGMLQQELQSARIREEAARQDVARSTARIQALEHCARSRPHHWSMPQHAPARTRTHAHARARRRARTHNVCVAPTTVVCLLWPDPLRGRPGRFSCNLVASSRRPGLLRIAAR